MYIRVLLTTFTGHRILVRFELEVLTLVLVIFAALAYIDNNGGLDFFKSSFYIHRTIFPHNFQSILGCIFPSYIV